MSNRQYSTVATDERAPLFSVSLLVYSIQSLSNDIELSNVTTNESSSATTQRSSFLYLPVEIRLAIYYATLVDNKDSTAILRTCRQINMEGRDTLYHRTPTFDSQAGMFAWISKSSARNLNRVRTMTFRLTDVDLESLLATSSSKNRTRTTVWSLYRNELQKLEQSLSALPSLSRLTILPPDTGHSQLLKNLYHSFLAEIPRRCSRLKQLEIHDDESLMAEVTALKEIHRVTFTKPSSDTITKAVVGLQDMGTKGVGDSRKAKRKRSPQPEDESAKPAAKRRKTVQRR